VRSKTSRQHVALLFMPGIWLVAMIAAVWADTHADSALKLSTPQPHLTAGQRFTAGYLQSSRSVLGVKLLNLVFDVGPTSEQPDVSRNAQLAATEWPIFKHDISHSGLSQYDSSGNLGIKLWRFKTGGRVRSSPTVFRNRIVFTSDDGIVYTLGRDGGLLASGQLGTFAQTPSSSRSAATIAANGRYYIGSPLGALVASTLPDGTPGWQFKTGGPIQSSPVIGPDGTIYVGSDDNRLYAITDSNASGVLKWSFATGGPVESSPAIGANGTIYVGSDDDSLYAVNPDGTEKWAFGTGGAVRSSPAIGSDGTIYFGSEDGKVYAVTDNGSSASAKWTLTTGASVRASPSIGADGTVYVGSHDHKFYAINPGDGSVKWFFQTNSIIESSAAIGADGTVYIGSFDQAVYAINPLDGSKKWVCFVGGAVGSSPAIAADGTIYVGSIDDVSLYAIGTPPWPTFHHDGSRTGLSPFNTSANNGQEQWRFATGSTIDSSPAIGGDGTVYFQSMDGNLYALNPDGTKKWSAVVQPGPGFGPSQSSPALGHDATVYVGSYDDFFYAFNPDGTKKWTYLSGGSIVSSPLVSGFPDKNAVYFGSSDGKVYAINDDGDHATKIWSLDVSQNAGDFVANPLAGGLSVVYATTNQGMLWAIDAGAGTQKWVFDTGTGFPTGPPSVGSDGTIYFGSFGNGIYAIDPAKGTPKWQFTTCSSSSSTPAIGADGTIYFGCAKNVYAIIDKGTSATTKWVYSNATSFRSSPAIGGDGTIYIGADDKNLYAINSNGTLKWNFSTLDLVFSSPAIGSDGTVYVGSEDKHLYAIGAALPAALPSATATPTATATATSTSKATATATATTAATATNTATATATATGTVAATETATPTATATPSKVCGTVVVTSPATGSGPPGSTVPAGSFTIQNICPHALIMSAVHVTESNAGLLSSLGLKSTIDGQAQTANSASASTATFNLSPALALPGGDTASFALTATIANAAGGINASDQQLTGVDAIIDSQPTLVSPLPDDLGSVTSSSPSPTPTPTVPAVVKVSTGLVNFGKVKVGTSKSKVVSLTDTASKKGGATVNFSGGTISGSSDFSGFTSCTGPVAPKGKCTVTVMFAPTVTGTENASVTINSNASNSPNTFSMVGTGK